MQPPEDMALECAHCGHRADDGATRCPKCLRSQLLTVPETPAAKRRGPPAAVLAIFVVSGLTATLAVLNSRNRALVGDAGVPVVPGAHADARDTLVAGPELVPLVAQIRAQRDPAARLRAAGQAVAQRRQAALFAEDDVIPPPRAPDLVWRLLPAARERFTELDLARLITAALRVGGEPSATVVERLAASRPDVPADPTGSLGSYAVKVGEHVLDVATATVLPAAEAPHRPLDDAALGAAVSSQAALEMATAGGGRDRAVELASAAVQLSHDAPIALAARARVWIEAGGSGGLALAEADLQAAASQRDDAGLHLARTRLLLVQGRVDEAATATVRAARRAPAWGTAALAALALRDVITATDGGALDGCAMLRAARAPWTDDAYALCAPGTDASVRTAAAQRLLDTSRDPLRVAWSAAALTSPSGLRDRVRPSQRGELARWLLLLRRPELAAAVVDAPDAGR
jgi:hypothetical protein